MTFKVLKDKIVYIFSKGFFKPNFNFMSKKCSKFSKTEAIKYILKLIKPYWYFIFLSIFFSSLASFFSGAIAWFVKPLFDKVFLPQNYHYLKILPFAVIGIFGGRGVAVFLQAYFMKKVSYSLGKKLRIKIYEKVLKLPVIYSTQKSVGGLISRVINDTLILENLTGEISKIFFLETLTVLILITIAFIRSWQLTLLVLILIPLAVYISEILARKTHRRRSETQEKIAIMTHTLSETLTGLKELKVFLHEKKQ